MPYITRDDGERFIIPSYRDVITTKKTALLKKEILLLAESYGGFIYLQKKSAQQYEVAFSPEPGTLLGETVWHYFKRPRDLIYCETIPNTTEAILVIVKGGSVYLDGSFSIESIPDELVIFQTQQNNFEIYVYGDVPISQIPEAGKFTLDASSVKSFAYLEKSAFQVLPILKAFQLQPVDLVLKSQGIGVFPLKKVIIGIVVLGLIWIIYLLVVAHKKELPKVLITAVNPYQLYLSSLSTPDPTLEIKKLANTIVMFSSIPGWDPTVFMYNAGNLTVGVISRGMRTNVLFDWAKAHRAIVNVSSAGFSLSSKILVGARVPPNSIYDLKAVVSNLIDRLSYVLPGNALSIGNLTHKGKYNEVVLVITFTEITPTILSLIGDQLNSLPLELTSATVSMTPTYNLSGTINLKALGN